MASPFLRPWPLGWRRPLRSRGDWPSWWCSRGRCLSACLCRVCNEASNISSLSFIVESFNYKPRGTTLRTALTVTWALKDIFDRWCIRGRCLDVFAEFVMKHLASHHRRLLLKALTLWLQTTMKYITYCHKLCCGAASKTTGWVALLPREWRIRGRCLCRVCNEASHHRLFLLKALITNYEKLHYALPSPSHGLLKTYVIDGAFVVDV